MTCAPSPPPARPRRPSSASRRSCAAGSGCRSTSPRCWPSRRWPSASYNLYSKGPVLFPSDLSVSAPYSRAVGMMMAVSFERYGRLYYLDPGGLSPAIGDKVLVPTDSGPEVAECVWAPQWVSDEIDGLPVCEGIATADDLARDAANRKRRAEGRLASRRLIREHKLPMKVTAVDFIGADNVFVVYFSAPHRVDFRALVRDLGGRLKARVELRQIGPRDEARLQGGIGPWGRDLPQGQRVRVAEGVRVHARERVRPGRRSWLAAAAILLAGCSSSSSVPNDQPSTSPAYYAQHLAWQPCENGFQCARLVVPFDYARPGGPRFSLPVVKLPATDAAHRVGALVVNPGGPGGSGVQYALAARGEFPPAVRARFDIVGFDPRGVSGSEPAVSCMTGPELARYLSTDEMPDNAAQLATVVRQGKFYASRCEQNSRALLPYVGTQNAARDLDVLRAALGQSRLTYLGKSYGTYLGTWYAQLFPHRLRALVLVGAVDPDTTGLPSDAVQAEGFQTAFGSFAAWCRARSGCPLGQNAAGQLETLIVRANSR